MNPAMALYEARMALAEALRAHVPLVERHAAAELAEAIAGEQRWEELRKQENAAIRRWVEATAEGR